VLKTSRANNKRRNGKAEWNFEQREDIKLPNPSRQVEVDNVSGYFIDYSWKWIAL
jgi:hypothetical protein